MVAVSIRRFTASLKYESVTLMCARRLNVRLSPNCHYNSRKTNKNKANPENRNCRYLTAGKGI
jgi:hypothetical protein